MESGDKVDYFYMHDGESKSRLLQLVSEFVKLRTVARNHRFWQVRFWCDYLNVSVIQRELELLYAIASGSIYSHYMKG